MKTPTGGSQPRLREFELIKRLASISADGLPADPELILGIGDDAAALEIGSETLLMTTDTLVDGVHFRSERASWRDIGWKSIAVNQSDIAAMGGRPERALVTLGLPTDAHAESIEELYHGMRECLDSYGGSIIGGDIVRSPTLFITVVLTGYAVVTAAGAAEARGRYLSGSMTGTSAGAAGLRGGLHGRHALLRRDGALPGDQVAVTGSVGGAAAGLRALDEAPSGQDSRSAIEAQQRPRPRVRQGQLLASHGARAAIDLSDGLVDDLRKLAAASAVGAVVQSARLPVHEGALASYPSDALHLALTGGEDYELLFTAPPAIMAAVRSALEMESTVIGEITEAPPDGEDTVRVLDQQGHSVPIDRGGWDHLRD